MAARSGFNGNPLLILDVTFAGIASGTSGRSAQTWKESPIELCASDFIGEKTRLA